jgi:hypothetical protein
MGVHLPLSREFLKRTRYVQLIAAVLHRLAGPLPSPEAEP